MERKTHTHTQYVRKGTELLRAVTSEKEVLLGEGGRDVFSFTKRFSFFPVTFLSVEDAFPCH